MTNHHVGADALQKISTKEQGLSSRTASTPRTQADEFKCDDLELNVLMSIEDVTERGQGRGQAGHDAERGRSTLAARSSPRSRRNRSTRPACAATSSRSTRAAQYHLYRFKKYTDVRLVFAPEQQIAFFGGDPDNFEYPRYDLDICFFRVYENDKPAKIEHYLKWSKAGAKDDELVFVSGHPGRTDRLDTVAELEYLRDTGFPFLLQRLNRWEVLLTAFSGRSEENARRPRNCCSACRTAARRASAAWPACSIRS